MADKMKRFTSWNVKYNTEWVKARLDALRPDMQARYQAASPLRIFGTNDTGTVSKALSS